MTYLKPLQNNFIKHCNFEKSLSLKTIKAYQTDLNQFWNWLEAKYHNLDIDQISKIQIKCFLESISNLKPKSIKRKIATLKVFFSYLEHEDIILNNPFHKLNIKIKEPKALPIVLDMIETKSIFNLAYQNIKDSTPDKSNNFNKSLFHAVILELLFATGARVSEVANIKLSNLNLKTGCLRINGKGNKERLIQICNVETLKILNKYHEFIITKHQIPHGFFLVNRLGNKISDQSIRNIIKHLSKAAGITKHITPHKIRHTVATLLLENDVDIKYIQTILGHSSISTTQIYTHVNSEKQRQILSSKHPRNDISMNS